MPLTKLICVELTFCSNKKGKIRTLYNWRSNNWKNLQIINSPCLTFVKVEWELTKFELLGIVDYVKCSQNRYYEYILNYTFPHLNEKTSPFYCVSVGVLHTY